MMPSTNDVSPFGTYTPRGPIAGVLRITRCEWKNWLCRRLAFVWRTLGIAMLRGRPLDVLALGAKMRLYPAHNVSEKNLLFTPHLFDPEERDVLARHMGDNFTFIDIGANVGGYSLFAAALAGPHARLIAIEPHPEIFERLIYNVRQNPFGTVKALECAVTDKDGVITLFVDPANSGESSVRYINARGGIAVKVATRTLKHVLEDEAIERLDALKVDVEGAEDLVLEPFFRDVHPSLWPKVLIVDSPPGRPALDIPALAETGSYKLLLRNRSNCIFVRQI